MSATPFCLSPGLPCPRLWTVRNFWCRSGRWRPRNWGRRDELIAVCLLTPEEIRQSFVVLQSEDGYFLRFPLSEITKKKKNALGIRGMSLKDDDAVRHVYVTEAASGDCILYKDKELYFQKIRQMSRDSRGVKVRR